MMPMITIGSTWVNETHIPLFWDDCHIRTPKEEESARLRQQVKDLQHVSSIQLKQFQIVHQETVDLRKTLLSYEMAQARDDETIRTLHAEVAHLRARYTALEERIGMPQHTRQRRSLP